MLDVYPLLSRSRTYAKQLRKEVNTLEDYSLKETSNTLTYDMINLARGRA